MIPIASNVSQNPSAPLRVAANREKTGRNQSIVSDRVVARPPTALVTSQSAALPTPTDVLIGRIIVRTFIVLLAIAGGIVLAWILGVLLGFIQIVFC
jgi:hypothetical protein